MEYAMLGKSDLKVSRIGLGAMQFGPAWIGDKKVMKDVLNHALDNGVTFIDTAEIYGVGMSEKVIGEVVKERGDRDDLVIASKVHPMNLGYDDVLKAAEGSLKRLQMDTIDLYQIHHHNPYAPASEIMKAMSELLKEEKIRYAGVSNYSVSLIKEASDFFENEITSNQMEYSILERSIESELLPYQREAGIVTIAFSPLGMGVLGGKYDENSEFSDTDPRLRHPLFMNKENLREAQKVISVMKGIADARDATSSQVALNWLLKFDDVFPIPGAKTVEQVESNISAVNWRLTEDEWSKITNSSDKLNMNWFLDVGQIKI